MTTELQGGDHLEPDWGDHSVSMTFVSNQKKFFNICPLIFI